MITIYVKTSCPKCKATVERFKKWGIKYKIKNIDEDFKALADLYFFADNFVDAPQVLIGDIMYNQKDSYRILKPKKGGG